MGSTAFMIIYYYFEGKYKFEVLWIIFSLAGLSDFLDGYLSRKWNVTSNLGKCLDPISDKLLLITSILILIHARYINLIAAFILMSREIIISGLREFLALEKISLHVSKLAKWKTAFQIIGIGACFFKGSKALISLYMEYCSNIFLLYPLTLSIKNIDIFVNATLFLAVYATLHTGVSYICKSSKYLK